ncbi:XRE family transcriptional regulator [Streptomyces sp. NBC_00442]|uniref:helix-turn-helix domain-containing protein n=1 Tax=Streptomyces sp. NBC_00442 TaxID=2903651 RepID=UPI002E1D7EE0
MPRWKALPDELDPQVREFASQLRRLVDRSGLSVAAVADRTGYDRTSWERYLGGRLLAPRAAVVALAEVTGANPVHLTTMWELAERAWSRSEQRRERTVEAMRADRARAAPEEAGLEGPPPGTARAQAPGAGLADRPPDPGRAGRVRGAPAAGGPPGGPGRGRRIVMFVGGVVGALLVIASAVLLTGLGKSENSGRSADPGASGTAPVPAGPPSPSRPSPAVPLPAGVKCVAASCAGRDPELMHCTDRLVRTVGSAKAGAAVVEVRYSVTCKAAWARLLQAAPGDRVRIGAGAAAQEAVVAAARREVYTKMLAVDGPAAAKACATLKDGRGGCAAGTAATGR